MYYIKHYGMCDGDYLQHYGVKGMKWRHHRYARSDIKSENGYPKGYPGSKDFRAAIDGLKKDPEIQNYKPTYATDLDGYNAALRYSQRRRPGQGNRPGFRNKPGTGIRNPATTNRNEYTRDRRNRRMKAGSNDTNQNTSHHDYDQHPHDLPRDPRPSHPQRYENTYAGAVAQSRRFLKRRGDSNNNSDPADDRRSDHWYAETRRNLQNLTGRHGSNNPYSHATSSSAVDNVQAVGRRRNRRRR